MMRLKEGAEMSGEGPEGRDLAKWKKDRATLEEWRRRRRVWWKREAVMATPWIWREDSKG